MNARQRPRGEAIDWQKVRARLERAAAASPDSERLSPEQARLILEERSQALARVPPAAPGAGEVLEIATFTLANEFYGIETRFVREVLQLTEYTPLPGAPPFLVGLLNLRGDILALLDLRTFFDVAARGVTDLARVFVLGFEHPEFGILADTALEVRTLRTDEVLEPPATVAGVGRDYLMGITTEALILLDGAALLRDGRLFIDQADEASH